MLRLVRFSVEDHPRLGGRFGLDLSRTRGYRFSERCVEDGIVAKAAVLGTNGSGMTCLGHALTDMSPNAGYGAVCGPSEYRGTVFSYVFSDGRKEIAYRYSRTGRTLSDESLAAEGAGTVSRSGPSDGSFLNDGGWKGRYPELDDAADAVRDFGERMMFIDMTLPFSGRRADAAIADAGLAPEFRMFMEKCTGRDFSGTGKNGAMLRFSRTASPGERLLEEMFAVPLLYGKASLLFIDGLCNRMNFGASRTSVSRIIDTMDCQVIGSTFNTALVGNDIMRPDCIFMMKKDGAVPLCDLYGGEIRYGNSLEKMLRQGDFGSY